MAYIDANATFPVAAEHYAAVVQRLKEADGNPSSIHSRGRLAKVALEAARASVAKMLGARGPEIAFTSGATEANNLVIQGLISRLARERSERGGQRGAGGGPLRFIVSAVEHSSVLEPARLLEARAQCAVVLVAPTRDGVIEPEAVAELVDMHTAMISVMHANNETGAVNDIAKIAALVKAKNPAVHLHVDAVQVLAKRDLAWYAAAPIDSASISAHKIGGFKGVGALYLRPGVKLQQFIAGGGQERGRRPGTENMPGILSFGMRCDELARIGPAAFTAPMRASRRAALAGLRLVPGLVIHGSTEADSEAALPNTINFHIDGVPGDDLLLNLDLAGIQASSGSACSSGANRPSHVLTAMGYGEEVALNSVRLSFTDSVEPKALERLFGVIREVVARKRR